MKTWEIRRATDRDAVALTDCIKAAYAKYSAQISDLPDVSSGVADDISNNLVWVAVASGCVVGGMILVVDQKQAKLANIVVHPSTSGKGLGRKLLDLAVTECQNRDVDELSLATHAQMPDNIAIYQKLGWQETGRQGNTVSMTRKL